MSQLTSVSRKMYRVFSRTANSFESFGTAPKRPIEARVTLEQARRCCTAFNDNRTPAQVRAGIKYEFESI